MMTTEFICACSSQKGPNKEVDQDSVLLMRAITGDNEEIVFAVICDGVGGMKKGEWASAVAAVAFEQWFRTRMPVLINWFDIENTVFDEWTELIKDLHSQIKEATRVDGTQSGTTLEVLMLFRGRYYIGHVGDCRVYLLDNKLEQLTHDHTFVQREVDAGRMTPEQARVDKNQNLLLQCIGAGSDDIHPDFIAGQYEEGQMFLLCCDGQRRRISDAEIEAQLLKAKHHSAKKQFDKALSEMVGLCRKRGEKDDISSVMIMQKKKLTLFVPKLLARKESEPANAALHFVQDELLVHTKEFSIEGDSNKKQNNG